MADGVLKDVHPINFRLISFFDPSTPSMRKGDNGGNGKKEENNDEK